MSEREVDALLRALEQRTASAPFLATRPGEAAAPESPLASTTRAFSFAPVFYPGTPVSAHAMKVTVGAGEVRSGLDFSLGVVPTASVAGVVTGADGQPASDVQLTILSMGPSLPLVFGMGAVGPMRTGADGAFQFGSVTPGTYRITARRVPGSKPTRPGVFSTPTAATGRGPTAEWAVAEVTVTGDDVGGVTLVLQPGLRLAGRIVFEGTSEIPSNLAAMRVSVIPVPLPVRGGGISPVPVKADGSFEVSNLLPGEYRLELIVPDAVSDTWWPRSGLAGGRDLLDAPLELIAGASVPNVVFTLADRRPSLSGTLRGADGGMVVVFSADRSHWQPQSRRVRGVRAATDGHYRVRDLPPGEYLVTVVADAEPDEIFDPAFLERLVADALPVSIGEGEQRVQDVRVDGGRF